MLYAVSEITGFMLLATLLGGAAGWWLARSGKVSVSKAMDRSGAHAAAERELESARAEIAQLTAKLAVARDAIRELETEGGARNPVAAIPDVPAGPLGLHAVDLDDVDVGVDAGEDVTIDDHVETVFASETMPPSETVPHSETMFDSETVFASETVPPGVDDAPDDGAADDGVAGGVHAAQVAEAAAADARPGNAVPLRSKDRGGKRLSTRVAEASVVSRSERAVPKIEFGEPAAEDD